MSWFRKKKEPPAQCAGNPGVCHTAEVGYANGDRTWNESIDLVRLAAAVLEKHGHAVSNQKSWLEHRDSGYILQPLLVEMEPLDDGGAKTTTTIQINHPTMLPAGAFEYQHSTGESAADSISKGFDQWVQTDWVTLLDAAQAKPANCTFMEMELPKSEDAPARVRRAVLGPIAHFMQNPPETPEAATGEDHSFCPCCLLTRSFEAFKDLMTGDQTYCLRLFAARNAEGDAHADCRVNGENWEVGAGALREYVETWPETGFEFRKQYVILHSVEKRISQPA